MYTAGESVANILRQKILSGEIPDGTNLTQEWIASQLGVSRIPIREALHKLEYECLIERLSNHHTRVIGVGKDMLKSRARFVAALEIEAAFCIIDLNNINNPKKLKKFLKADYSLEQELLFHYELFCLSKDRYFNQIYLHMGQHVLKALLQSRHSKDDLPCLAEAVDRIEHGDKDGIRICLEKYYSMFLA